MTVKPDFSQAPEAAAPRHSGLRALCSIAAYYRIAADPNHLVKELAIEAGEEAPNELVRAAVRMDLKARVIENPSPERLASAPVPALLRLKNGSWCVYAGVTAANLARIADPATRIQRELPLNDLVAEIDPLLVLVARRFRGAGVDPKNFGFHWFAPSLWRYRKPLIHVLIASFFVQLFAL
ncbi:ABC-type bacteriocin/lantibiotic exporter with double-glycine peptidase domain, partial [Rhodoblastus acidophilus]